MAPRNEADLWRDLVAEASDETIHHASQVTVGEAERDLLAAGFDVAKERAKARGILDVLDAKEASVHDDPEPASDEQAWVARVPPTPIRPRATPARWLWLVAATLALATGGGVLYGLARRPKPVELPREVPTEVPTMDVPPAAPRGGAPPPAASESDTPVGSKGPFVGKKTH